MNRSRYSLETGRDSRRRPRPIGARAIGAHWPPAPAPRQAQGPAGPEVLTPRGVFFIATATAFLLHFALLACGVMGSSVAANDASSLIPDRAHALLGFLAAPAGWMGLSGSGALAFIVGAIAFALPIGLAAALAARPILRRWPVAFAVADHAQGHGPRPAGFPTRRSHPADPSEPPSLLSWISDDAIPTASVDDDF